MLTGFRNNASAVLQVPDERFPQAAAPMGDSAQHCARLDPDAARLRLALGPAVRVLPRGVLRRSARLVQLQRFQVAIAKLGLP